MRIKTNSSIFINLILIGFLFITTNSAWKYETKCTRKLRKTKDAPLADLSSDSSYSIVDDFIKDDYELASAISSGSEQIAADSASSSKQNVMRLKCANINDFLFIGLAQYGVSAIKRDGSNEHTNSKCELSKNDCLINVDYLANECNGLNSCDIQLDSQFLHTCKNHSDYLSVAYECIQSSKRLDICSNDELFIIDSSTVSNTNNQNYLASRFGSFYLSSPNYPNEYTNNLSNCSCKLDYVQIDNSDPANPHEHEEQVMNLAFKSYEFDLEDYQQQQESHEQCTKDYLKIESSNGRKLSTRFCGQMKKFKEFYAKGNNLKLNFTTDDAISRRGFLIKISPIAETKCPMGTQRFDSTKCIKYFGDKKSLSNTNEAHKTSKLNWHEAQRSCESMNGRLLNINSFLDNFQLNALLRNRLNDYLIETNQFNRELMETQDEDLFAHLDSSSFEYTTSYWSNLPSFNSHLTNNFNIKLKNKSAERLSADFASIRKKENCLSKHLNYWQQESCLIKQAYICEFDPIPVKQQLKQHRSTEETKPNPNRLIRVACGSSSRIFSSNQFKTEHSLSKKTSTFTSPISTVTTTTVTTSQTNKASIENTASFYKSSTSHEEEHKKDSLSSSFFHKIQQKQKESSNENSDSSQKFLNMDLSLVIAVVCGASLCLILLNIFCIWNFYTKKWQKELQNAKSNTNKADCIDPFNSNYRTSTMIRSMRSTHHPNNTQTSTGLNSVAICTLNNPHMRTLSTRIDSSYLKLPQYEVCLTGAQNQHQLTSESMSSAESTSTANASDAYLISTSSKNEQNQLLQHYYETISCNRIATAPVLTEDINEYHNLIEQSESQLANQQQQLVLIQSNNNQMNTAKSHQIVLIKAVPFTNQFIPTLQAQQQPQQQQQQQQYSSIYDGDLLSSPSSSMSVSSNQPLITFASSNNSTNSSTPIAAV